MAVDRKARVCQKEVKGRSDTVPGAVKSKVSGRGFIALFLFFPSVDLPPCGFQLLKILTVCRRDNLPMAKTVSPPPFHVSDAYDYTHDFGERDWKVFTPLTRPNGNIKQGFFKGELFRQLTDIKHFFIENIFSPVPGKRQIVIVYRNRLEMVSLPLRKPTRLHGQVGAYITLIRSSP